VSSEAASEKNSFLRMLASGAVRIGLSQSWLGLMGENTINEFAQELGKALQGV
jgi:hypothetical protein